MKIEIELKLVILMLVGISLFLGVSLVAADPVEHHYVSAVGIISVKNTLNADAPAILMLLNSGYVAPVLLDGETASVASVYYTSPDCAGDGFAEYTHDNMFVMSGSVFKVAHDQLYFIPFSSSSVSKTVRSVRRLETSFTVCENVTEAKELFLIRKNDLSVTRWEGWGAPPIVALRDFVRTYSENTVSPSPERRPLVKGCGMLNDFPEDEICSAGCLEEQIGDGVCQKACFVMECSYDEDDCTSEGHKKPVAENECAAECAYDEINDGVCDPPCDVAACGFDGEDCLVEEAGNSSSR